MSHVSTCVVKVSQLSHSTVARVVICKPRRNETKLLLFGAAECTDEVVPWLLPDGATPPTQVPEHSRSGRRLIARSLLHQEDGSASSGTCGLGAAGNEGAHGPREGRAHMRDGRTDGRTFVMGDSSSSSASYIRMVQHLIEKCLLFHMSKAECVEALSKHANIKPVITATDLRCRRYRKEDYKRGVVKLPVWAELEKENKEFFEAYSKNREESVMEMRTVQMIRTVLTRMASRDPDEDED
ncbi:hypothetical protein B296_00010911 [Ensete ventricosum]|uniref:Uncharacterized protein n=1 Tax=Ensete ventricosum TaxID=4639 RepID=A0A427B367_ENSVE|nr:hypothetical protein B296_00010911 [Ensete ventricosum]